MPNKTHPENTQPVDRIAKAINQMITFVTSEMYDGSTGGSVDIDQGYTGIYLGSFLQAEYETHPDWRKLQTALKKHKAIGVWTEDEHGKLYAISIATRYRREALKELSAYVSDIRCWDILVRINALPKDASELNGESILLLENTSIVDFMESGAWRYMTRMLNTLSVSRADYTSTPEGHLKMTFCQLGRPPHEDDWVHSSVEVDSRIGYMPEEASAQERIADLLNQAKKREIITFSARSYGYMTKPIIQLAPKLQAKKSRK